MAASRTALDASLLTTTGAPVEPRAPTSWPTAVAPLAGAVRALDGASLRWLSGYAAGLADGLDRHLQPTGGTAPGVPALAADTNPRIAVIHGSQTGNARRQAERLAEALRGDGHAVELRGTAGLRPADLARWSLLLVAISTQGDGEPPEEAIDFLEALAHRRAPRLEALQYAVLALGDSSYPQFCAIGRQLDARLEALGARRVAPLAEADVDIDTVAQPWMETARRTVAEKFAAPLASAVVTPLHRTAPAAPAGAAAPGPAQPWLARIITSQPITDARASRAVHHVELDVADSGLDWQPGDALALLPRNPPSTVAAVLDALALDGAQPVRHDGAERPLQVWLTEHREITRLHRDVIAHQAQQAGDRTLAELLADPDRLRGWIGAHQLLDLARSGRGAWDAQSLVARLKPLAPRLYSIASSRAAFDDELHLTVAALDGAPGAASSMLIDAREDDRLPVYVVPNPSFRLPADSDRDVIMIGAGTGVAPFRAFLQQRIADRARGRHWLLFGNRRFREDFLYQLEWQAALARGELQRLSLAFSRDGGERVRLPQRLREEAAELREAIAGGAHLYVCGSLAMGRDVHAALVDALAPAHGGDAESADAQLRMLRQQGRYARDLY